jgi:SAM-dependent methyltransferase
MAVVRPEYFDANRRNWDERAGIHARSRTYDLASYLADPDHLSGVVRFDRRHLGDLGGRSAVHLQCHIGTDTLSLARLGASTTGLDQSEASIAVARDLFERAGTPGRFEVANVYDAVEVLGDRYDLVYTGVGALNWIPDISRWAGVVAALLAPGGRLHIREGHPVLWALDEDGDPDELRVRYPYFETAEPLAFDEPTTYTDGEVELRHTRTYEWNHGLGEIITALLRHDLVVSAFEEHRELEWQGLPQMRLEDGRYRLPPAQRHLVPLMYTLVAERRP